MIVERRTFYIKPGSLGKAIELAKESAKFVDVPHGVLLYTHFAGEFNVLMGDVKFENVAELEEFWKKWWSHPDVPEFMERWLAVLQERSGKNEILNLVE